MSILKSKLRSKPSSTILGNSRHYQISTVKILRNPNLSFPILPMATKMSQKLDPQTIPRQLAQLVSRPGGRNTPVNDGISHFQTFPYTKLNLLDNVEVLPAMGLYESGQAHSPIPSGLLGGPELLLCSGWDPETGSGKRSQEVRCRFEDWVSIQATGRRRLSPEPKSYVPDSPSLYPLSPPVPSSTPPSVPEPGVAAISTTSSISWVTTSPSASRHSNDSMPPATGMEMASTPELALPPSTTIPAMQWVGPSLRCLIVEILRFSSKEDHSLRLCAISSKVEDFRIANELPRRAQEQSIRAAIHHARKLGHLEHATASGQRCGSWRLTDLGQREGGLDDSTQPPAWFKKSRSQAEAEGNQMSRADGKAVTLRRSQRKRELRVWKARATQP